MNIQRITKKHSVIIICLALVSMMILFATPFITALDPICLFMQEDIVQWMMRGLIAFMLICAGVNVIRALISFFRTGNESTISKMSTIIKFGLGGNIAYCIFCLYIILKIHAWDVLGVLSGDTFVTTHSYIPMFVQILLVVGAAIVYKNWENKITAPQSEPTSSNTAPQSEPTSSNTEDHEQVEPANAVEPSQHDSERPAKTEMEQLELLKKYKELLDSGIITEDEYTVKKKELLGIMHTETVRTTDSSRVQKTPTEEPNPSSSTRNTVSDSSYSAPAASHVASAAMVDAAMRKFQKQVPTKCRGLLRQYLTEVSDDCIADLMKNVKIKRKMLTLFLSVFFGGLGADRFYLGETGAGMGKLILRLAGILLTVVFPEAPILGGILTLISSVWCIIDIFVTYKSTKMYNYETLAGHLRRQKAAAENKSYFKWGEY